MSGAVAVKRAVVVLVALVTAACGSGDGGDTTQASSTTSTTVDPGPQPVSEIAQVREAVVRITAEGTFEYPTGTSFNEVGSGSGFFISPQGAIVTNNHVVAGAGLIRVYLDGADEPVNGRLVGVSECADLAVVDVDASDAAFLAWADEPATTGTEIRVAGFPLGDPEYTLVDGIISKEDADGDTDWASIDHVVEHSADTLPGSSGGPIVDESARVVAVNYAGDDLGQAFGISTDVAREVVDDILAGETTLSIGVNGWAYQDELGTGVWVASVIPDSLADRVGIQAGDLITRLAGLIIAEDGTLAAYCDILDSNLPDRPFDVEVWRGSTGVYMAGVINSDQTLVEASAGFAEEELDAIDPGTTGEAYSGYDLVYDDAGLVSLEVPVEWADRTTGDWEEFGRVVGTSAVASVDIAGWEAGWDTPGVFLGISADLAAEGYTPESFLGELDLPDCTFDEQVPYDDGLYVGASNIWIDCGAGGATFVDWAAMDAAGTYLMSAQFTLLSDADIDAMVRGLETLYLTSDQSG